MSLTFASMVRETSTTTGTGTYDLAGASDGYAGFVAGAGDAAVVVYRAQMGDDWEIGIGTVADAAPDTLARTEILQTLVSGVLDNTSPAAVTWGAGTKTIDLIGPAESLTKDSGMFLPHPGQQIDGLYYHLQVGSAGRTVPTDIQMFFPHYHARRAKMTAAFSVTTLEAGKSVDIGLYNWRNGLPNALLESFVSNSLGATGQILVTTTNAHLPGWYCWSYLSNAAGTAQARGTGGTPDGVWQLFGFGQAVTDGDARNFGITRAYSSGLLNPFSGSLNQNILNRPGLWMRPVS